MAAPEDLVDHDAADALALVHEIEGIVDVAKRHRVRDHRVDLDFSLHVPIDDFWHVGGRGRRRRRCHADPAGDKLKRPGRDFLAGTGDAMMMLSPQPRWQLSSAARIRLTLPMHSKV